MTQYNSLNVKVSNSQLNKLKSAIKNESEVVLRLSSNMIGDNETNFPHKLLLTNRQVSNLRKAFANHLSADIKLSKTQLSKMIQSGGFLGRLLGPLLKTGLPLIKNIIKPLAKSILIPLGLIAAASAADARIRKKSLGSGHRHLSSTSRNNTTTIIISNDEMKDIIKIVKSLDDSGLLLKRVSKTVLNEAREQKGGFISMLLGTLGASLLGNILAGKGVIDKSKRKGQGINRAGESVVRAGYENKKNGFLMPPHPLTHFEIQNNYQNESRFNGVYSIGNLPKIKDGVYLINLDEYSDFETHWVAMYVRNNDITFFESFGVEHIPKEIKAFICRPPSIKTNIFRIQAYESIMCGYFSIGFIDFMLAGKTLTKFTNLFSPNN